MTQARIPKLGKATKDQGSKSAQRTKQMSTFNGQPVQRIAINVTWHPEIDDPEHWANPEEVVEIFDRVLTIRRVRHKREGMTIIVMSDQLIAVRKIVSEVQAIVDPDQVGYAFAAVNLDVKE